MVHDSTGIPLGFLRREGNLADTVKVALQADVVNQQPAINGIVQHIRRAESPLGDGRVGPIGSFFFLGPSGVGKTWVSKRLAHTLFGEEPGRQGEGDSRLVRIDLSEYAEKHSVSRLIGAPPGYIGFEHEGQLTEPVRRKKACVVLLDEIDKAHSDVQALLLQMLEDGRLTDGQGRTVNFSNTIVIVTSNHGSHVFQSMDPTNEDALREAAITHLRRVLRPELLNRTRPVVFNALDRDHLRKIADMQIQRTIDRLKRKRGFELDVPDATRVALIDEAIRRSREGLSTLGFDKSAEAQPDPSFGARPVIKAAEDLDEVVLSAITEHEHPAPNAKRRSPGQRRDRLRRGSRLSVTHQVVDSRVTYAVDVTSPEQPKASRRQGQTTRASKPAGTARRRTAPRTTAPRVPKPH